jgi:acetyl-CoA carboxylase carboxyl transferase subunit alpha
MNFLDFEQPIAEIEAQIEELRLLAANNHTVDVSEKIKKLENKNRRLTKTIFEKLTSIQKVQLARHIQRPHASDYIQALFTEFDEFHGDRHYGRGASIVGGLARFEGEPVIVLGHEKGRKTSERVERNFGMPSPEDYRKALRLMKQAEKFELPVITFIDTPGAYPGITAEEHNQSEAIARNLLEMSRLKTPIVSIVIGEGGSGGALALGVADRVLMMQYSIYSVISPEGCASILWKSAKKADEAAEALGVTADHIQALGLIDGIIAEPLGGAHRQPSEAFRQVKHCIGKELGKLQVMPREKLLQQRYQKLTRVFEGESETSKVSKK